mmetsp:Transcript_99889/g.280886  ORF Transcript_99889/g.280886 Transcript_99889/m.280886 type:complete len:376 (-) Transcript_99889:107-1234(-)
MGRSRHHRLPHDEDTIDASNVYCNIYDIVPSVNSASRFMRSEWGIYHTGVQVHGLEISYGGHPDASTGVFCAKPRSAQGCTFRERLLIGRVELDPLELRTRIAELARQWPGNTYNPFERNCNHFTDFLCRELTSKPAPPFINEFTHSRFVRGVFYGCVMPVGRCLEKWYDYGGITYTDDAGVAGGESNDLGISGARGINQVLVEAATSRKATANTLFKEGQYAEAREAYNKAMGYLATMSRRTEEEDEVCSQADEVRMALLLNLAACDLKSQDYARAVDICDQVLENQPGNQKARYRRGIACSHLGRLDAATADFRKVLQTAEDEGDSATVRDARREIARVKQLSDVERAEDRALAKRMMGVGNNNNNNNDDDPL